MRAFIPEKSVAWVNKFINAQSDIDVWLSIRLINQGEFSDIVNSTLFKYYTEFKCAHFDLIHHEFASHQIKLQVLVDDLDKYLDDGLGKSKRNAAWSRTTSNDHFREQVVGKYVSYEQVDIFK